ncbi:hypothetical protein Tco_1361106 [Tanacetum coccineum]
MLRTILNLGNGASFQLCKLRFKNDKVDVANIPCDSNKDDDLEQQVSHEADDDTGYDLSDIRGDDEAGLTNEEFTDNEDEVAIVFREDESHEIMTVGVNMKRFKMIKYSFGQDKEYVAVKEDEYDDLAKTSDDACRAYRKIFRIMDEGWMVTRAE